MLWAALLGCASAIGVEAGASLLQPVVPAPVLPDGKSRDLTTLDGAVRVDPYCLLGVWLLTVLVVLQLAASHSRRWSFPRLQVCDLRVLFFYASLSTVGLAKAATGWPLLPLRAMIDTYTVYLTTYALPVLLIGGDARLASVRPESVGPVRTCRRILLVLLVLRPLTACLVLLAGSLDLRSVGGYPWGPDAATYVAYVADTALVVVALLTAVALQSWRLQDEGARSGQDGAAKVRREVPSLVLCWLLVGQAQDLAGLGLFASPSDGLALSGVLIVYEVLAVLLMTRRELDPAKDQVLLRLSGKDDSGLGQAVQALSVLDILTQPIPFEKSMFYSLRSALDGRDRDGSSTRSQLDTSFRSARGGTSVPDVFRAAPDYDRRRPAGPGLDAGLDGEAQPSGVPPNTAAASWPQRAQHDAPPLLGQSMPVPLPVPLASHRLPGDHDSEGASIYSIP